MKTKRLAILLLLAIVALNTTESAWGASNASEATQAAAAFVKEMSGKAEFSQIVIIHLDYVRSIGNKKAIEAYEFYKTPAGSFAIHKT